MILAQLLLILPIFLHKSVPKALCILLAQRLPLFNNKNDTPQVLVKATWVIPKFQKNHRIFEFLVSKRKLSQNTKMEVIRVFYTFKMPC